MAEKPVIVFLDTKTKANRLKKFCSAKSLQFDAITEDLALEPTMSVIRNNNTGVVAALGVYGRGADIRFRVDSHVIVAFIPHRLDILTQMVGRSSRTM